uniref:Uncharacterized protein n=1 Tax=Rhizophora mucronata TaxID=61149 RepID=A0A2P2PXW4_RHIMU
MTSLDDSLDNWVVSLQGCAQIYILIFDNFLLI